uniref:Uncharacterized protein n=1 Tax=Physcomitrium patens TaxID=3218 RepID=A0A2K1J841_PHYPA|nr:hypothetical protein PHYPA_020802 [Physcomitrium patens]
MCKDVVDFAEVWRRNNHFLWHEIRAWRLLQQQCRVMTMAVARLLALLRFLNTRHEVSRPNLQSHVSMHCDPDFCVECENFLTLMFCFTLLLFL